ncbi:MAG: hypothetical protein RBJ76_05940 [Stenomitos frigidus ULC029]
MPTLDLPIQQLIKQLDRQLGKEPSCAWAMPSTYKLLPCECTDS